MVRMNWLKGKIGVILASSLVIMTLGGCGSGVVGGLSTSTGSTGTGGTGSGASVSTSVTLNWDQTVSNTDGSAVNDLAGYKVYYGTSSGNLSNSVDVGSNLSGTIDNLVPGNTYYFAVTSYDTSGNESSFSSEVSMLM